MRQDPVIRELHGEQVLIVEVRCDVNRLPRAWHDLVEAAERQNAILGSAHLAVDPDDEQFLLTGYLHR